MSLLGPWLLRSWEVTVRIRESRNPQSLEVHFRALLTEGDVKQ
jgi:hypothetical protein